MCWLIKFYENVSLHIFNQYHNYWLYCDNWIFFSAAFTKWKVTFLLHGYHSLAVSGEKH